MFNKEIMTEAVDLADKHRKVLHTIPESAFEERETTAYIKKICADYPVKLIDIGMETGAVYYLDAGREETVALRADIDALLTEQGPRHLCGHDAHSSTLLGAVHYLCAVKDELPYNVLFIFQPGALGLGATPRTPCVGYLQAATAFSASSFNSLCHSQGVLAFP